MRHFFRASPLTLIAVSALGCLLNGQTAIESQAQLEKTLAALDASLFDSFNRCDVEKFQSFFDDSIEFYHDEAGFTSGKDQLTKSLKENICGGDVRRELVPGTLKSYPMKNFGAVQTGEHRFLHPKTKTPAGEAKFVHLWRHKDGGWKIVRVISYDHHRAP